MKTVRTRTKYLEMLAPPAVSVLAPVEGAAIERIEQPSVEFYRFLYNSVGRDHHWVDRNRMPDEELRQIVQDEQVEVYLLTVVGEPAGYAELDRRQESEVELAYFGLFPEFVGRGLGKYFLAWAVERAWSHRPRRVWVHTCDLDHPAALPNYEKAGFVIFAEEIVEQVVGEP